MGGVFVFRNWILNLLIRLNTIVPDSSLPHGVGFCSFNILRHKIYAFTWPDNGSSSYTCAGWLIAMGHPAGCCCLSGANSFCLLSVLKIYSLQGRIGMFTRSIKQRTRRKRKALLIGINYDHTIQRLIFPQRDTRKMFALLKGEVSTTASMRLKF